MGHWGHTRPRSGGFVRAGVLVLAGLVACEGGPAVDPQKPAPPPASEARQPVLTGTWRAVLGSPGGELPFSIRFDRARGEEVSAVVLNAEEEVPFSSVTRNGEDVRLELAGYDSRIVARLDADQSRLVGEWSKTAPKKISRLPFVANRGDTHRFATDSREPIAGAPARVDGEWAATFTEEDGTTFAARAVLATHDWGVRGTFLTDTGDYRYLAGSYEGGRLRLSCFDGGHAFLFHADAQSDGTLAGDFWSRDTYHALWTAHPIAKDGDDGLADPTQIVKLTNDDGRFEFSFRSTTGKTVSSADQRFSGKVLVIDIFGTWCPNCNDQAPLLATWHRRYRERGLEVVGLAYEMTGDPERDMRFVSQFKERYGIEFPLLLAGTSDKKEASKTVADLSEVDAFPTTIFVGRDGKVRRIHSGFSGPATGAPHTKLVAEQEQLIEELLAEPPPDG